MAIEGVKLQLTSEKLKKLLEGRAEYHSKKAEFYKTKAKELAPQMEEFEEEAEEIGKMSNSNRYGSEDPVDSLNKKGKHHTDRATYFRFMAENLIPNETFILQEHDLQRLEVMK
jgi:hypothetical protein